jgi:hypothetical protein
MKDFLTISAAAALSMFIPAMLVMTVLDLIGFNLMTVYYWILGIAVVWVALASLYYYWFTDRNNDGAIVLSWYYFFLVVFSIGLLMLIGSYKAIKYFWILI